MPKDPRITKGDVENLSRGLPTESRIGSRAVGHRLTQKERILFEAAKKLGRLKVPVAGSRGNVERIYQLWCEATGTECIIVRS
jgi:hypothetical protein